MTITYAMLEAGLTGSGGMTHDIGFRGTIGARKSMGPMTIGAYFQTEQRHEYDNLHVTSFDGTSISLSGTTTEARAVIKCNGDGVGGADIQVVVKMLRLNNLITSV